MSRLLALLAFVAAFAVALTPTAPTVYAADTKPVAAPAEEAKDFFFKPNDRIVFLGDNPHSISIHYIELYLTTRMPKGNFTFLNAGISDTANGGAGASGIAFSPRSPPPSQSTSA